ncbi:hypothetical protein IMC39_001756 [Salmonella enterica]|nr:hypothetical protein [Salmonella enterica]EGL7477252.1 hypothetical protein [Salmonella enterica]
MPRMYVYENEIRIRGVMENSLFIDITNMLTREFGDNFDRRATVFSVSARENIYGRWCFLCHGTEIEAADFIIGYFDNINRSDLTVRFCLPWCGEEIWTGELSVFESDSSSQGENTESEKSVKNSTS